MVFGTGSAYVVAFHIDFSWLQNPKETKQNVNGYLSLSFIFPLSHEPYNLVCGMYNFLSD